MSNFWQRTITGALFVACIAFSIWEGPVLFQLLFFIAAMGSLREFYNITTTAASRPNRIAGYLTGILSYLLISTGAIQGIDGRWAALLLPAAGLIFFAELYRKQEQPFTSIAFTLLGILYAVVPFALLNKIAGWQGGYDRNLLMGYFILLWSSDTFAYLSGSLFGRRRLFPRISPKKSWEGSIGATVATAGLAYLLGTRWESLPVYGWMIMAVLIVVCGTLGDLTESLLKRSMGIKDSGNILPGHGGFLDRFDALLLSVPFVWAYLAVFC